jgi:hypothetical protein
MNIDISGDPSKTVAVGSADKTGSLFSIEKPKGIPLAGGPLGGSKPPAAAQRPTNPPPAAAAPPPPTRASDAHDMLNDLANPVKETPPGGLGGLMGSETDDSMTEGGDSLTDGTAPSVDDYVVDEQPDQDQPSPGFVSIDDEKSHILWKLSRAKRNGMPVHRNLSIDSNIRELRNELKRVEYELSLSQSLRFQKRMLCLAVSGMEVLTERYSLFDLQLQGWSSQVQDDIDSFDSVLSRLHDKYKDRAAMAPELQLLLMLVSSAISFHVTKSMMKSMSQPGGGGLGGLLQSMMGGGGGQAPKPPTASVQEMNEPRTFQRAPMRGPTPMSAMGVPDPMQPPQMSQMPGEKRPRDEDRQDGEDQEDRISDVVSDTTSGDDSTAPAKSDTSESSGDNLQIQTIPVAGRGRGRGSRGGRGGRGRGAASKTVVTL